MRLTTQILKRCQGGRAAVGVYMVACDPGWEPSLVVARALIAAGVDFLELGYPFTDPLLDGPVIQRAQRRALDGGGSLARTLDLVAALREDAPDLPIVLMGYLNPLLAYGLRRFARAANAVGVDALIVADLPIHEAQHDHLPRVLAQNHLALIPLSVPTAPLPPDVFGQTGIGGFVYCIAAAGLTGGTLPPAPVIAVEIARCRSASALPVAVGFGIRTAHDVEVVSAHADAVIVGSAVVNLVERWTFTDPRREGALRTCITSFAKELCLAAARGARRPRET